MPADRELIMGNTKNIEFEEADKGYWIRKVTLLCDKIDGIARNEDTERKDIVIKFNDNIKIDDFTHVHVVLYSCLIEYLVRLNYCVNADIADTNLHKFIFDVIHLTEYYKSREPSSHVEAGKDHIFNIWKIVPERVEEYSTSVINYFKRKYFEGLDLSGFKSSLDEVFANVCDHSKSDGIAFSYIYYEEKSRQIKVSICDFGVGIPYTLRESGLKFNSDGEALRKSVDIGVTARTNDHNRGFGLDNVISNLLNKDRLRIVSNKALLLCHPNKDPIKYFELDFDFKGTLIYFEVSIDSFQEEDELSDMSIG